MSFLRKYNLANFEAASHNKAILWMTLGGFAFATMGALTHQLGKEVDWLLIAFFRMLLTFVITLTMALKAGINPFLFTRKLLWFRSFVGSSAMLGTFYALTRLPISDVAVLTETRPIWVALIAGYVLGETTGRKIWISIVLGIIGVILVEGPLLQEHNLAGLIALYAAVAGAVVMICLRKLRRLDPRIIVTHFSGTASLIALVCLLYFRGGLEMSTLADSSITLMLLGVGIFGTIGQLAMTKAFSVGEASSVASAGYIKVGFSAGYDIILWHYVFEAPTVIGMLLILCSTAWLFKIRNKKSEKLK